MKDIKGTVMVLKVDLQCCKCYRKIKRLLCRYQEIGDQEYDEKNNTVTIIVFCCTPERVKQKLICNGGKTIQSIDIVEPKKPKADTKPKQEKSKPTQPPQEPKPTIHVQPQMPKSTPQDTKPTLPPPQVSFPTLPPPATQVPKPTPHSAAVPDLVVPIPIHQRPQKPPSKPDPAPPILMPGPDPFPCYPTPAYPVPVRTCCMRCYEGYHDGPCYQGFGPPPPPPPSGYYGRPCYCSCGGRRRGCGCTCGCGCYYYYCETEENQVPCSIM